jgi:phosphatidylglycerol:prolipoprotein diacylglycerol transferase
MHPVLVEIPLPDWRIPWLALLLAGALLGLALALFGWRQTDRQLAVVGALLAAAGLVAAVVWRHKTLALSSIPVYSYGALLALSFVVGWIVTLRLARAQPLPLELSKAAFFVAAISALLGARALYVLTNPTQFGTWRGLFDMHRGGLVAYGGFLGGLAGSVTYLRVKRQSWSAWADAAAPSLAAGLMITRLGCYLFGCDFGRPLSSGAPGWLQRMGTFPRWEPGNAAGSGSPAWLQHVAERGLSPDAASSLPVHPTQLYESIAGGLLLVLTLVVWRKRRFAGQVLLTFALGYGVFRFSVEFWRDDAERGAFGPELARHLALACGLLVFGAACSLGPGRSLGKRLARALVWAAGPVAAMGAYALLRPAAFAAATLEQLSTSQWTALFTGIAAALAWRSLDRRHEQVTERQAASSTD